MKQGKERAKQGPQKRRKKVGGNDGEIQKEEIKKEIKKERKKESLVLPLP